MIIYCHCTRDSALLRCYNARVTSVEYNKVPEKAYVFTFAELGSF